MAAHEGCPRRLAPASEGGLFYKSSRVHSDFTSKNIAFFKPSLFAPGSQENMISPLKTEENTGEKNQE
jgi:hypothetical protein